MKGFQGNIGGGVGMTTQGARAQQILAPINFLNVSFLAKRECHQTSQDSFYDEKQEPKQMGKREC